MKIKIEITRTEPNPDYVEPKRTSDLYRQPYDVPSERQLNILSTEISEEQFEAIRKAVLETF